MNVKLPDGTALELPDGATGLDAAAAISPRLAQVAAAVEVDGALRDLRLPLPDGAELRILRVGDADALPVLRHSAAHVMAEATRSLFPGVKVAIGPAIDNGFYYDFDFPEPISDEDLERIEAEMRRITAADHAFTRTSVTRDEARAHFDAAGEVYKVELIDDLPASEPITYYTQDGFTDLCRGPHLQSTKQIKAFKLTSLAGAYWRGDSDRPMLTRIYGTAFFDKRDLQEHLERIEEAKRRDHRKLGRELGMFSFHPESPGMPFWHENGMAVWNALAGMWREQNQRRGYREVRTPLMYDAELWKVSGHWGKYRENMYTLEVDERPTAIKPMNCPAHCLIFKQEPRSYRDLPLRIGEMGHVHRQEPSGTLHGLMRVRAFVQDDAHLFCRVDQIQDEVQGLLDFAHWIYDLFGMEVAIELSTRPEERVGDDSVWDAAEQALAEALDARGTEYRINAGDGAFYGPKIDMHLTDSLGRSWQCGTIQLDFNLPARFELVYTGADDSDHRPVMIHRALFGSFERFIGVLLEHYAGAFPLWLAPEQAVIIPVSDRHREFVEAAAARLRERGLRVQADAREQSMGKKIAEAYARKVPVVLVAGDREVEADALDVQRTGRLKLGSKRVDEIAEELVAEIAERRPRPTAATPAAG